MSTLLTQRCAATRLAFAFLFLLPFVTSRAQTSAGGVSGSVVDAATGKFLEGAEFSLDAGATHQSTGRDGRLMFSAVSAGAQSLTVAYPGFDSSNTDVTIVGGHVDADTAV